MAADNKSRAAMFKQRAALRHMMRVRTAQPNCPIPTALSNRVADWILMMVVWRMTERKRLKQEYGPDVMADDIGKSAEAIEILFVAALEDITDTPALVICGGPVLKAANDERISTS